MKAIDTTLVAADGHKVPHVEWQIEAPRRARLLIVHGRGEHGRRYEPVARALEAQGIECHAIDLRGFGRTVAGGVRAGAIRRFGDYFGDIEAAVKRGLEGDAPPLFLLGHSMGGLAAARWLEEQGDRAPAGLRGLVLTSPFLAMPKPIAAVKLLVVRLLSLLAPDKPLPTSGNPNTRDEACREAYLKDPMTVKSPTARWVTEVLKHQALAFARAKEIRVPILILQAGADTATLPDESRRFADLSGGDYKEYGGFLHEVLNEPEEDRRRVLGDLTAWILELVSRQA